MAHMAMTNGLTNMPVIGIQGKSRDIQTQPCFTILGQVYIVKMVIFDQFYHHRKEWSYRDLKYLFGNGMARGTKWEHVEWF